ncbi:hypothetical protein EDD86DRAFT_150350 [Gorgonomyces haynaldii]|nr:hypothetical protein EDD86DRAFT_150350 [Gorgonomyces haynaldii]
MATIAELYDRYPTLLVENQLYHYVWGSLHLVAAIVGLIACSLVIFTSTRKSCDNETLLFLSVTWSDLCYCVSVVIFDSYQFATDTFLFGEVGCAFDATVVMLGCGLSMLSLAGIAVERYMIVLKSTTFTKAQVWNFIISVIILCFVFAFFPFYTGGWRHALGIFPSLLKCSIASWDAHLLTRITIGLAFLVICATCFLLIFCYMNLYLAYRNATRLYAKNLAELGNEAESQTSHTAMNMNAMMHEKRRQDLERKIFIKCLTITVAFLVCWAPYVVRVAYEAIEGRVIVGHLDGFLCFISLFNAMLNPFLLYIFDPSIKRNIHDFFGFRKDQVSTTAAYLKSPRDKSQDI